MSIPVPISDLESATAQRPWAYLLTVRSDLSPRAVAVGPYWEGSRLVVDVGQGTARNAEEHSSVALCYPPIDADGYSLIVDGIAEVREPIDGAVRLAIEPSGAVLHRPATYSQHP